MNEAEPSATPESRLTREIVAFLRHASIEATPHEAVHVDGFAQYLAPGTWVYVAHPPRVSLDQVISLAGRLRGEGFVPVPHIVARKLKNRAQLDAALAELAGLGVDRLLVVAGDAASPAGEFRNSLDVLRSGLLQQYGVRSVAVAGHPEGSRAIGPTALQHALQDKVALAAELQLELYIVSQFGFDPQALIAWEERTSRAGVRLPVHVGLAGVTPFQQLVRYAMRCGVGASLRMIAGRITAMSNVARLPGPDTLVTAIARQRIAQPASRLVRAHFFAFGGVEATARWLDAVRAGRLQLNEDASGFEVEGIR